MITAIKFDVQNKRSPEVKKRSNLTSQQRFFYFEIFRTSIGHFAIILSLFEFEYR